MSLLFLKRQMHFQYFRSIAHITHTYMKNLIENFPIHLSEAATIVAATDLNCTKTFTNIIISGLGGSGIGGSIVADLVEQSASVPVVINKGYHIPAFANENTLFIAVSYSGNTEETLLALDAALAKGCTIYSISSGGKLKALAEQYNFPCIVIPGGNPPRSMLGYSLIALLGIFKALGLSHYDIAQEAIAFQELLENGALAEMHETTQKIAENVQQKVPVVYACSGFGGVATRWRQQLNENSKLPGWDAVIPEMNHNELVGWAGGSKEFAVFFLRTSFDFSKNSTRTDIAIERLKDVAEVYTVVAAGSNPLQQTLHLIHFGDWLSYYLSELRGVDIMDIEIIDYLKATLAKLEK